MFNLFKRNKPLHKLPISEAINRCFDKGAKNLHINLSIDDQMLFQVMPARHFEKHGFFFKKNDMAIVYAFSGKKNDEFEYIFEKFKSKKVNKSIFSIDDQKGVYLFLNNIGSNPQIMEQEIHESIKIYELGTNAELSIEYLEY